MPLASDGTALTAAASVAGAGRSDTMSGIALVWTGNAYDIFWSEDQHNGVAPVIVMARLASDGRVLSGRKIIDRPGRISSGPAAVNGGHIALATSNGYLLLDLDANVLDSGSFGSSSGAFAFATGAADLTLINPFASMRIDAAGRFATLALRKESTFAPRLACHAEGCILAYETFDGSRSHLAAARFNPVTSETGAKIDLPIDSTPFDVVAVPGAYLLITTNAILRLDENGRVTGSTPTVASDAPLDVATASNGRDVLMLTAGPTISASLVTSSGIPQRAVVARVATSQEGPAIATSGNEYLVAWREGRSLHATRLALDGTPLESETILADSSFPDLSAAYGLGTYAVAYDTSVNSAEVDLIDAANGKLISRQTLCGHHVRVAGSPGMLTAAWIDCAGNVVAAPLGLLPIVVANAEDGVFHVHPSLAWNGTAWLIAWEEEVHVFYGPEPWKINVYSAAVRGMRFTSWLTPIDTKPIEIAAIGDQGAIVRSRVASDGGAFLAAWGIAGPGNEEVHARRIASNGSMGADTAILQGRLLDLIWDGNDFDLGFLSGRFSAGVARIGSSGEPLPFETLAIGPSTETEPEASLVAIGTGRVTAAYTRLAREALYGGASRVFIGTPHPTRGRATVGR